MRKLKQYKRNTTETVTLIVIGIETEAEEARNILGGTEIGYSSRGKDSGIERDRSKEYF